MRVHIDDVKPKCTKNCGKCIFCLSKCPNCKSIDVSVEFVFFDTYRYRNNIWNHIYLKKVKTRSSKRGYDNRGIVVKCNKCGTKITEKHKQGKKLFELINGLYPMPSNHDTTLPCHKVHYFIDDETKKNGGHFIKVEWERKFEDAISIVDNYSKKELGELTYRTKKITKKKQAKVL